MIACLDVDYRDDYAVAACVLFSAWTDKTPSREIAVTLNEVAAYEPGEFYRRELPCLQAVLEKVTEPLTHIVVDGYVWLDDENHPGLGAHLFRVLESTIPVIGVAKTRYQKATLASELLRGQSQNPLYVTAAGMTVDSAARNIQSMHGEFRIPTMLKNVDRLCRTHIPG